MTIYRYIVIIGLIFSPNAFCSQIQYVATNGNDLADGLSWTTPRATIQAGISSTDAGGIVLVSNGVYHLGAVIIAGTTNRISVTNGITVKSLSGPSNTIIRGGYQTRAVSLSGQSSLIGFTVSSGTLYNANGAGISSDSSSCIISNCIISNNSCDNYGAGTINGTLYNCVIRNNTASDINHGGGGCVSGVLFNCFLSSNSASGYGGAALFSQLSNCVVEYNIASSGGGTYASKLFDCSINNNYADTGGGAALSELYGCQLATNKAFQSGGAAYTSKIFYCSIRNNSCSNGTGGGVHSSIIYSSLLSGNSAFGGGAAYNSMIYGCTIIDNFSAPRTSPVNLSRSGSGGIFGSYAWNSIIYYNTAQKDANYNNSSVLQHCCTWPLPEGPGNITNSPLIASRSNPHLLPDSKCINAGNNSVLNIPYDINRGPRTNDATIDIGCVEYGATSSTGQLSANIEVLPTTNAISNYPLQFQANIFGQPTSWTIAFGDNTSVTNIFSAYHSYESTGTFTVTLTVLNTSGSFSTSTVVSVLSQANATRYVSLNGNDSFAGTNWATSKQSIQAGIDAAPACGTVLVSNGVYTLGNFATNGALYRAILSRGVVVKSVNGPLLTSIQGGGSLGSTSAISCVSLSDFCMLSGFTLYNGRTPSLGVGGGVSCQSSLSILTNCHITGNIASLAGGGCNGGTLIDCTLSSNASASGGGADSCILMGCEIYDNIGLTGAGVSFCTVYDSTLTRNSASISGGDFNANIGGGADNSLIFNCSISSNSSQYGGGASYSRLYNSYILANTATSRWSDFFFMDQGGNGGGCKDSTLLNCYISDNTATNGAGAYDCRMIDCVITRNHASQTGGGSYNGILLNCYISSNSALYGGGAYGRSLKSCNVISNTAFVSGGGIISGSATNCTIANNTASDGAGAAQAKLVNCLLTKNVASTAGGGTSGSDLFNCTVVDNSLIGPSITGGGGTFGGTIANSLVYSNNSTNYPNYYGGTYTYSCTLPQPAGAGNISDNPLFRDFNSSDYRLKGASPCINAGSSGMVSTDADLDGNTRIYSGIVDIGAYEYIAQSGYWSWASAITNGHDHPMDSAITDGYPNLLKYVTGANPTSPANNSKLLLYNPTNSTLGLRFYHDTNAIDVTLIIEKSDSISITNPWRGVATNSNGAWENTNNISQINTNNPVIVGYRITSTAETNCFYRLRVTMP